MYKVHGEAGRLPGKWTLGESEVEVTVVVAMSLVP